MNQKNFLSPHAKKNQPKKPSMISERGQPLEQALILKLTPQKAQRMG